MTSISDTEVVNAPGGLVEVARTTRTNGSGGISITATSVASASDFFSSPATFIADGSSYLVEVFIPLYYATNGANYSSRLSLVSGSTEVTRLTTQDTQMAFTGASQYAQYVVTPAAGVFSYNVRAWVTANSSLIFCGNAGSDYPPAMLRVSKILQASQLLVTQSNAPIVTSLPVGNLVTGQEVDLYVTSPYVGYQRYKWNGTAWYVIGDSRAQGVWQSFTPTLTQSSNVTFTINYAKYVVFGKTVMVNFNLSPTSSGVLNNNILLGFGSGSTALPTAASASGIHGNFRWFDAGVSNWVGTICGSNTTSVFFTNDGNGNNAGFSGTLTSGDVIEGSFFYEMA